MLLISLWACFASVCKGWSWLGHTSLKSCWLCLAVSKQSVEKTPYNSQRLSWFIQAFRGVRGYSRWAWRSVWETRSQSDSECWGIEFNHVINLSPLICWREVDLTMLLWLAIIVLDIPRTFQIDRLVPKFCYWSLDSSDFEACNNCHRFSRSHMVYEYSW